MAMGTNEQQVIHPFFRQEFGVAAKPTPSTEPILVDDEENEPHPIRNESPVYGQEFCASENYGIYGPKSSNVSSVDLVEDPNEDRRKRRRTDNPRITEPMSTSKKGLSEWLGIPAPAPSSADISLGTEVSLPTYQPQAPPSELQHPTNSAQPWTGDEKPESKIGSSTTKQKTLKLNPKGGFLSATGSSPPPETDKKGKGKRRKPTKGERKLVTIKYNVGTERNLGKLIDDILSGQSVHKPPAPVTSAQPRETKQQPRKPTHPFFSKGWTQNPGSTSNEGQLEASDTGASVVSTQATSAPPDRKRTLAASGSLFTRNPRRTSKFPELLDPIWPPQDLVHVKDIQAAPDLNDRVRHATRDQKKAKTAAVSIHDDENVLLVGTIEARRIACLPKHHPDSPDILRHPGRHIASNQVLQTAMEKQMSWSSPNRRLPWDSSSPPLARLRSALVTSFSAFDFATYESQLWAHKYAPQAAEDVLQLGREPRVLRDWLRHLTITAVDTGKGSKESAKSKLKREKRAKKRKVNKLDDFVVSSEDEASEMDALSGSDDELAGGVTTTPHRTVVRSGDMASFSRGEDRIPLANAILLSGPAGCGKTASVYAVAKELDFEVFEINPGTRRSARDMLERVGDMTQNHLVHLLNESENPTESSRDDTKQNKLMSFFKGSATKARKPASASGEQSPRPESAPKRPREQKQSLILLEEADLLFEEDRQFWTGVLTLISQSRRPIVITCNDESLIPTQEMSLHAMLRYQKPPPDFSVDYLLLVAANEGHMLKREAVTRLYEGTGMDLRKSLMDLNFWCQMGVGSEKAGLDWLLPAWPPGSNVDQDGNRLRVLSLNTYERYMGYFNRDMLLSRSSLDGETELIRNGFQMWGLGLQETTKLNMLSLEVDYYDMRSSLDILCPNLSVGMSNDLIDISAPAPPEGHQSNYLDSYPLLHTPLQVEYSSLSEAVSSTFEALINRTFRPSSSGDLEDLYANRALTKTITSASPPPSPPSTLSQYQRIFEPIMRANYSNPTPTARHAPSFENGLAPITEDLAPYVRAIMVFDGRLQQYREQLSTLADQEHGRGKKRSRTTRASRAALEGGNKAFTRKERWLTRDTPYAKVQNTAGPEWQQALFQMGYFHVQPTVETSPEPSSGHVSDDHDRVEENAE
ncbi:hypothetical protein N7535_009084 [Penicillium sp. DV-2018c]|nr:hypothetical protein N7535_009084 [Penicillium sp. DV-2018c]